MSRFRTPESVDRPAWPPRVRRSGARILGLCLAVGLLGAVPAGAATFVVNSAADPGSGGCTVAECTLREALGASNANVGVHDRIEFAIPPLDGSVKTIALTSGFPTASDPAGVTIDGYTQSGAAPNTRASGSNAVLTVVLDGATILSASGFAVTGGNSTLRGLVLNRFPQHALALVGGGDNVVEGCFFGTNAAGTLPVRNGSDAIQMQSSARNRIGGLLPAERNVISGSGQGVHVGGTGADDNRIVGNLIGTDKSGTVTDPDGVPGTGDELGNRSRGVIVLSGLRTFIGDEQGLTSDGPCTGGCNVISGSTDSFGNGISLQTADGTLILGNHVGTDVTGTVALGNGGHGLSVVDSEDAVVGLNLVSGNRRDGVRLGGVGGLGDPTAILFAMNRIGTDTTGLLPLGNLGVGVQVSLAAAGTMIGDAENDWGNVISANGLQGIIVSGDASDVVIEGNLIGVGADGVTPLGNGSHGIQIGDSFATLTDVTVGGESAAATNVVAYNEGAGVLVRSGTGHSIRGNAIFDNQALGIDLFSTGVTPNDAGDADTGVNDRQNFPLLSPFVAGDDAVAGRLDSRPSTEFLIEVFANESCDPSGHGEALELVGRQEVQTDAGGVVLFSVDLVRAITAGEVLTATATDPGGNTSELSPCVARVPPTTTSTSSSTSSTSTSTSSTSTSSSTSSSTSTTKPSTSTSSSTSSTSTSSTTSTTMPSACPSGATFPSIACRLDDLRERITISSQLGYLQAGLRRRVESASYTLDRAYDACRDDDGRRTDIRLRQSARRLALVEARLLSNRGRQVVDEAVREAFAAAAQALVSEIEMLRRLPGTPCP